MISISEAIFNLGRKQTLTLPGDWKTVARALKSEGLSPKRIARALRRCGWSITHEQVRKTCGRDFKS